MAQDNSNKDQEIIDLAKAELAKDKPKYVDYKIEGILKDLDIKPGPVKVPAAILYYMYHKTNPRCAEKPQRFFKYMKHNFQYVISRGERYYMVDGAGIDLSFSELFAARNLLRKYYVIKKTKKNRTR